ncbi:MAG: hypothetical protein K0V04_33555 [Deltaproteobacteria bacterium]|nr:hypothetical protein [Deltaproteobacteria bacterium]
MSSIFFRVNGEDYALIPRGEAENLSSAYERVMASTARWLLRSSGEPSDTQKIRLGRGFEDQLRRGPRDRGAPVPERWQELIGEDDGPYLLFRHHAPRPSVDHSAHADAVPLTELAPPPRQEDPEHWIEVQMLDESDEPLNGVLCEVELPDGQKRSGWTNDVGLLRIDGIVAAGDCKIRFPKYDAAVVEAG